MSEDRNDILLSKDDQEILGEIEDSNISPELRKHASRPCNLGFMKNPSGQAVRKGICEDTVSVQLHLKGDLIDDVRFQSNGCGFTLACGSVVTEMVRGKNIKVALEINGKKVDKALGGLPKEHMHCADLAANTLKAAALDALLHFGSPWKGLYRN